MVEDDVSLRKLLTKVLENAGYCVSPAADAREALAIHAGSPADLVITDIIMPDADGLQLIMELRRQRAGTPIFAISGGGRLRAPGYLEMARKLGARAVFQKPFSHEELLAAIQQALGDTASEKHSPAEGT